MDAVQEENSKVKRKIARCLASLKKDYPDIHSSSEPTKQIFIGNAGLTTKADESSLTELVNSIGSGLEGITLLPGKSYSFVTFFKSAEAKLFLTAANGQKSIRGSSSPVYMAYVDKVPTVSSPVKYELPPGLTILEEFVTKDEEALLINLIHWNQSPQDTTEGSILKHRQVRHFGYEFQYGSNSVDKDHPTDQNIPEALLEIINRIVEKQIMSEAPDQLTVNRYLPGQGIPPHVDTHCSFTDEILSLSVGSGITMDFRHVGDMTVDPQNPPHFAVYLKPRSLCVMTGPARYEWTHGICPRMTDVMPSVNNGVGLQIYPRQERISFTFRKIRRGLCNCLNKHVCDLQNYTLKDKQLEEDIHTKSGHSETENPSELERKHVLDVYDQIADHFSDTRHKPWPQVLEFVSSLAPGSFLLDVGCGNGKYLGHNKLVYEIGCDTSLELLKICQNRRFEVLNCNCLQLPYRTCVFDAVICIAVIHHLASEERRIEAITELVRVLRQGGRGLIYVWAMEQRRGRNKSSYLKQNKANRIEQKELYESEDRHLKMENEKALASSPFPVHTNRTEFVKQDMLVPWKLNPRKKYSSKENSLESKNSQVNSDIVSATCCLALDGDSKPKEAIPVFHRFYHVFKQSELETLCGRIEGVKTIRSYYDEGNWCLIFEKN